MNILLLGCAFGAAFTLVSGQPIGPVKTDTWPLGTVVLTSGLELTGRLAYDQKQEVVQLATEEKLKAFSVHQVQAFRFEEARFGILREFVPYRLNDGKLRRRKVFLEVVLKGTMAVYRRAYPTQENPTRSLTSEQDGLLPEFDYVNGFAYYIAYEGQLYALDQFQEQLFPRLCQQYGSSLEQFVQTHNLNLAVLSHQIRILNQLNYWQKVSPEEPSPSREDVFMLSLP